MVGINPMDKDGKIVPIQARAARQSAGITDYEHDWREMQAKMDSYGMPQAARLSVPVRDRAALGEVAALLHGLASDITAIHNDTRLSDFSALFDVSLHVKSAEAKLRRLGKHDAQDSS